MRKWLWRPAAVRLCGILPQSVSAAFCRSSPPPAHHNIPPCPSEARTRLRSASWPSSASKPPPLPTPPPGSTPSSPTARPDPPRLPGRVRLAPPGRRLDPAKSTRDLLDRILAEIPAAGDPLRADLEALRQQNIPAGDRDWLTLYAHAAELRRQQRLATVLAEAPRIVFIKRRTIRPSFFAYTEGQSDAQARAPLPARLGALPAGARRHPRPGHHAARRRRRRDPRPRRLLRRQADRLRLEEVAQRTTTTTSTRWTLADRRRPPAHRRDGRRRLRRRPTCPTATSCSTPRRCVQTVDCWWTEVSNLYTCDADGRYIRRLGFDQVHTIYPAGARRRPRDLHPLGLQRPRPDLPAAAVPDEPRRHRPDRVLRQQLVVPDHHPPRPRHPRHAARSLRHPHRPPHAARRASWPSSTRPGAAGEPGRAADRPGPRDARPCTSTPTARRATSSSIRIPLERDEFLVTYAPDGWTGGNRARPRRFGDLLDGRRRPARAARGATRRSPATSRSRSAPRPRRRSAPARSTTARTTAPTTCRTSTPGPGLAGVPRGTIKKLRVVALEFRAAGIGSNGNRGPAGGALVSTPVSIGNGTWDVKTGPRRRHRARRRLGLLHRARPARPSTSRPSTQSGHVVQTMRSWTHAAAGRERSPASAATRTRTRPRPTRPPRTHGHARRPAGRSSPSTARRAGSASPRRSSRSSTATASAATTTAQPVLDMAAGKAAAAARQAADPADPNRSFSLLGETITDAHAKRHWSDAYLVLTQSIRDGSDEQRPVPGQSPTAAW